MIRRGDIHVEHFPAIPFQAAPRQIILSQDDPLQKSSTSTSLRLQFSVEKSWATL